MGKLFFIFLTLFCSITAGAEGKTEPADGKTESNIIGHVIDKATGKHLTRVAVRLKGTNEAALTDVSGHYFLKDVPVGKFEIEVKAMGYETVTRMVQTTANNTLVMDFEVQVESVMLNDVVVSANRNVTKRKLAPSLINVLDTKLFEKTQSTDLSQCLKFQPGVRVESNCQNCGFSQVRINGLEGPYSQILIDSRPVFNSLASVYGLEQIPTNMIERVEVMRGGGSALFGSSAIAGVINVITKEPSEPSASFSHEIRGIGGLNTAENVTNLNAAFVTDDNRLGATFFGQIRHRSGYDRDGDGYTEMPQIDARTVGMRTFAKLSSYTRLTAELHNTHEYRRGGDLLDEEPHNTHIAEQLTHNNLTGSLNFSGTSADAKHRFNVYASFMKVKRKSYYGGGELPASDILKKVKENHGLADGEELKELDRRMASYGRTDGLTYLAGMQYSYDFDQCIFMPSQLTAGLEYNNDRNEDYSGYRPAPILQKVHTESAFLQNEWKTDRWSFLLGGRMDKHSMLKKAILSPRANIRFNPSANLVLRANYSSGFRAPQIFDEDLHVDNAGGDLILHENAKDLREERSNSFSLSADWYHNFGDWQLNLTTEAFFTGLRHAFSSEQGRVEANGITYIRKLRTNSEGAKVYGSNFEGKIAYRSLWQLQGGLTVQRSRWDKEQQWNEDDAYATRRIYRTPNVYAYFVTTLTPMGRLDISFSGNYTGSMLVGHEIPTEENGSLTLFNGSPAATVDASRMMCGPGQTATAYGPRTFKTPAFFEMGCKVNYTISVYKYYTLQLYAGMQNIFNAYQKDFDRGPSRDSAYIYGPTAPRSFFTGIKFVY